jgi:general secretion pathway protein J
MIRRSEAGFTLLETLVALAVLGMLVAALTQGMRTGVALWQTQSRQLAQRDDVEAAERTIRGLVARLDPGGPSGRDPVFAGAANTMTFKTTLPQAADLLQTPEVEVTLAVDAKHQALLFWRPHYSRPLVPSAAPSSLPLLRDVDRFEFSYWDPAAGWQPEWAGARLPKLIRIRVVFTKQSGRVAPAIIAHPARDRWRQ